LTAGTLRPWRAQEPEVADPYEEECIIMQELAQLKGEQEPPDEP